MDNPENSSATGRILQESALPVAPLAMPEQVLVRARAIRLVFLRPLLQWLGAR